MFEIRRMSLCIWSFYAHLISKAVTDSGYACAVQHLLNERTSVYRRDQGVLLLDLVKAPTVTWCYALTYPHNDDSIQRILLNRIADNRINRLVELNWLGRYHSLFPLC